MIAEYLPYINFALLVGLYFRTRRRVILKTGGFKAGLTTQKKVSK